MLYISIGVRRHLIAVPTSLPVQPLQGSNAVLQQPGRVISVQTGKYIKIRFLQESTIACPECLTGLLILVHLLLVHTKVCFTGEEKIRPTRNSIHACFSWVPLLLYSDRMVRKLRAKYGKLIIIPMY